MQPPTLQTQVNSSISQNPSSSPENQVSQATHSVFTRLRLPLIKTQHSYPRLSCVSLLYCIISVCLACLALPIFAVCLTIGLAGLAVVTFVALPFLLLSLLVARLLQFLRHENDYVRVTQLKLLIRTWIFIDLALVVLVMWLFFLFANYVPGLKTVTLQGLTLTSWVKIVSMICGVYFLSYALLIVPYIIQRMLLGRNGSGFNVLEAVSEVVNCLLILWGEYEVMKRVPSFNNHEILGLRTRKWIQVSVFVLIGYNIITLSTHIIMRALKELIPRKLDLGVDTKSNRHLLIEKVLNRQYIVYCASWMRSSICFILSSLMLLLTWVFYFGSRLDESSKARHVIEFGTWTCLSLLIVSFLWLIKTFVLLLWEAQAIYNRLGPMILDAGKQLYFLRIISRHNCDILNLQYEAIAKRKVAQNDEETGQIKEDLAIANAQTEKKPWKRRQLWKPMAKLSSLFIVLKLASTSDYDKSESDEEDEWGKRNADLQFVKKLSSKKREKVRHDLFIQNDQTPTLFGVEHVGRYLLTTKNALSKELHISDILDQLKTDYTNGDNGSIMENLKRLLNGKDNLNEAQESIGDPTGKEKKKKDTQKPDFEEFLAYEDFSEEISYENLGAWMERVRNSCIFLANTIGSAKEVADCLNKITSWLLVGVTFIVWLLLTGLATTKVLVLIASPLLAATFIFGETCKTLFQGIIFVFVVHPFDVGDLCVIDERLMEVKAVGVWRTTFSKVEKIGKQEEIIYPNSELVNKVVINHKTEFDCNDYVEFNLGSSEDDCIQKLKNQIEDDLKNGKFATSSHSVSVFTGENNIKLAVRFEHKMDLKGKTYFECLKEKDKLRSEFIIYVHLKKKEISGNGHDSLEDSRNSDDK